MAAIGTENACRKRERGSDHASRLDVDAVYIDQILRQPQRQCDKRPEDKEIIERKAPDLDVLEGLQLEPGAARLFAACASCHQHRIIVGEKPERDRHDRDTDGPDLGDRLPAIGDKHEWREELRYRRADIADTENTEGGPLFFGRIPPRNIGNTDGERPAGDTDKKRGNEELWICRCPGEEIGGNRRRQHHQRVDDAAPVLVGPHAESDSDQGSA